jgi:thiosulfate/3-mercaptopyruvate sulfurtransferase
MQRAFCIAACFGVLLFACQGRLPADGGTYPQADLLVEAGQLAQPQFAAKFVILDARPREKYDDGHIPNAGWVDANVWARAFDHGQDSQEWSQRIGSRGVGAKTTVIVYDDVFGREAARVWWILRYWGVDDVRLLNGGWKAWTDGHFPVQTSDSPASPVQFVSKARPERLATKERLLASLAGGDGPGTKLQIVDARSEREFCGVERMRNPRAGAIPGAKHLDWVDLIDKRTQRFKSPAELRELFASAGIDLNCPTATHCQSGGRASVMAFGMELMGAKDVSNYYPSWAEWSSDPNAPVIAGQPKASK